MCDCISYRNSDGHQKWQFLQKPGTLLCIYNDTAKNFVQVALCHTVAFLHFMQKLKIAAKNLWEKLFLAIQEDSGYTLEANFFVQIAVSHTISKGNMFLHFTQKFKMATKIGGKMILGKTWQIILCITYRTKTSYISLYVASFQR